MPLGRGGVRIAEAVGCPIPRNWVKIINFPQSSLAEKALVVIPLTKSSVFSKVRAARRVDFHRASSYNSSFVRKPQS